MKRLLLIFAIIALSLTSLSAQDGLAINQAFDGRFRSNSRAVETIIRGTQLKPYRLDVYHCLNLQGATPTEVRDIEKWVQKDASRATSSEVSYRGGVLYYGFYMLPKKGGKNRYIIYANRKQRLTLLYLEGDADANMVKAMIDTAQAMMLRTLIPTSRDNLEALEGIDALESLDPWGPLDMLDWIDNIEIIIF